MRTTGGPYQCPIRSLQGRVAVEAVIKERDSGTPHQQYHSLEVKLCTKGIHLLAVIHHSVVATRNCQSEKLVNIKDVLSKSRPSGEVTLNTLKHRT
jgi:hypothetical protein